MATNNPFVPQTASAVSTSSRYITNPKHLSLISVPKALIVVKTAQSTTAAMDAAGGFTALARRGASASISVADTYVTVANLSGAGFLFNCISPTHDGAAFTPTFRITVDGTAYVIAPSAVQLLGNRVVLGPITQGTPATSAAAAIGTDVISVNASADAGFQTASVGGVTTQITTAIGIPTPEMILSNNMQCLRFETSLVVEMKASLLSGTAVDKQCAVTFRMDLTS